MPTPEVSQSRRFQGLSDSRDASKSRNFPGQSIDLKTANAATLNAYSALGMDRASVRIQTGTWGTAVVTLKGSVDGSNYTAIDTFDTSNPQRTNLDVQAYPTLKLEVTTNDAGAAAGTAYVYLYRKGEEGSDFSLDVAQGKLTGITTVNKVGRNVDIDTITVPETIWDVGAGIATWQSTASTLKMLSGSANDDGDPTSNSGAHTITVEGLDANFAQISETFTLNGTSLVTGSTAFLRVNRAYVATCGTYHGSNEGAITCQWTGTSNNAFKIAAGVGETEIGLYTVPAGKTAYLMSFLIAVAATNNADVKLFKTLNADDTSNPFTGAERAVLSIGGVAEVVSHAMEAPIAFPAKTDLEWQVTNVSANNTSVSIEFDLMLIDD